MIHLFQSARSYQAREQRVRFFVHSGLFFISCLMILPMLLVVSASFSTDQDLVTSGYALLPQHFTFAAYQYILSDPGEVFNAYGVTLLITVIGTVVGVLIMALFAYALSRRSFTYRKFLAFAVFFTLLFNGGLVPAYILVTQYLHLKNTLMVLILPTLAVPWFILLLRTYFLGLPQELLDAAKIDGAGEWRIFFRIVIPLSTPALATIGLFSMLAYWNDWFTALLYIDDQRLFPLQYLLYQLTSSIDYLSSHANTQTVGITVPVQSVRMAMVVIATGPIVFAFLLVKRYFVRGITVGSLKGD